MNLCITLLTEDAVARPTYAGILRARRQLHAVSAVGRPPLSTLTPHRRLIVESMRYSCQAARQLIGIDDYLASALSRNAMMSARSWGSDTE